MSIPLLRRFLPEGALNVQHSAAAGLDARVRQRLLQSQLDGIYAHITSASLISTLFALALAFYLIPVFGAGPVHIWLALKATVAGLRFVLAQAYRSEKLRSRPALANALVVGSLALDGAIWGFAGTWGVNEPSEVVCLLVACVSSVAALATFGLQVRQQATAAFVIPMLVPLTVALAWRGDALGLFGACGAMLVLMQTLVTGFASEKRLIREFTSHEHTAQALEERSKALQLASSSKAELERALALASKTSADLEHALEQVRRQSAVKALFLGTMSHELRTPLHGILGMAELVQQQFTEPVAKHRLGLIRSCGSHLLELIGALLDVSRIESGHLELHLAPFDLAEEIRNMCDLYDVRCNAKGIGFQHVSKLPHSCWVRGDAARVRQVLHNLLGNAVKFTDRGLVRLSVHRHRDTYVFEVTDTGRGISAGALPHVFDAFRQVDGVAAAPSDGTGLGLTIARELAQAMSGNIEVTSMKGVGSRFVFTAQLDALPLAEVPDNASVAPTPPKRLPAGYRILLVEDNEVNILIAHAQLEKLGVDTDIAQDGREAVKRALAEPRPDLILMDCRMPVMDGPSASREIRARERASGFQQVPIIALTAMPSDDDKRECYQSGMNGFVSKPFTVDELLRSIEEVTCITATAQPKEHPLLKFANSLGDMEPDLFGGLTMH
jgi:two-component system, sensor histidine kinase